MIFTKIRVSTKDSLFLCCAKIDDTCFLWSLQSHLSQITISREILRCAVTSSQGTPSFLERSDIQITDTNSTKLRNHCSKMNENRCMWNSTRKMIRVRRHWRWHSFGDVSCRKLVHLILSFFLCNIFESIHEVRTRINIILCDICRPVARCLLRPYSCHWRFDIFFVSSHIFLLIHFFLRSWRRSLYTSDISALTSHHQKRSPSIIRGRSLSTTCVRIYSTSILTMILLRLSFSNSSLSFVFLTIRRTFVKISRVRMKIGSAENGSCFCLSPECSCSETQEEDVSRKVSCRNVSISFSQGRWIEFLICQPRQFLSCTPDLEPPPQDARR